MKVEKSMRRKEFFQGSRRLVLLLVVLGLVACGGEELPKAIDIEAIEHPDLSTLSESVRQQLEEQRAELERLDTTDRVPARDRAAAYGRLGQLYQAYEFREASQACYRSARAVDPEDFRWSYLLGMLHQAAGDGEQAAAAFRQALEQAPDDLATTLRLAEVELSAGRSEAAGQLFEKARGLEGGEAAVAYGLGRIAAAAGDDTAAIKSFERALELQSGATTVHYLLAVAHRRQGDEAAAERHLKEMGNGEISFPDPLADQIEGLGTGVGILSEAAITALSEGRVDEAIAKYERALALESDSPTALRGLAVALRTAERFDESVEVLERMLSLYPDHALATMELGTVLMEAGDFDRALTYFDRAIALDADFTVARLNRAVTLERAGRSAEAAAELREALARDATNQRARLNLAAILVGLGETEEATSQLREAIRQQPGQVEARQRLGDILLRAGDPVGAEEQYQAVVSLAEATAQDRAVAHYQMGRIASLGGDHRGALERFGEARKLAPEMWQVGIAYGNALLRLERYEEAASEYQRVSEADPKNPIARIYLAEARMRSGRWAEALAGLEKDLQELPESIEVAHKLARALVMAPDPNLRQGQRGLDIAGKIFQAQQTLEHAETVVMAMAELGRFGEAVDWQEKLVTRAQGEGRSDLLTRLRLNLERYRGGQKAEGW